MSTGRRAPSSLRSMVRSRLHTGCTAFLLVLASTAFGCTNEQRLDNSAQATSTTPGHAPAPASPAGQLGLGDVMRRVHFAFRPEGDSFRGGHTTYAVHADARAFEVAPYQPAGEAPGREGVKGAAFVAALASIERGGVSALNAGDVRANLDPSSRVAITHGGVVEHLENTEEGVEQSFSFATKPAGRGDLEVRIAVSGEVFTKETETGLHFMDPATGLGVCYGVATWIDARGQKTAVPVDFEAGHIVLRVPERALDEGAFPAVLDPVIGPEFGIDQPIYVPAYYGQTNPAVAYGNGQYLAVWEDGRAAGSAENDIYGARVTSAGVVLDETGFLISAAANAQEAPDVAFDGTNWMVTWTDKRINSSGDIYAARVSGSGTVLDPNGKHISSGIATHGPSSISFDGTQYFIAYKKNTGIYGRFASPAGTLQPEIAIQNSGVYLADSDVDVAFNGLNYLVVNDSKTNNGGYYVRGHRVTPAGVVLGSADLCTDFDSTEPCNADRIEVSSDGTNWFAVWSGKGMMGQRVTNSGVLLDGMDGKSLGLSGAVSSVVYVGGVYSVFAILSFEVRGAQFNSLGNMTTPWAALVGEAGGTRSSASAAHDGTNIFLVFEDTRGSSESSGNEIFGLRLSNALAKLDPASQRITQTAHTQMRPAVAYNGTDYLAVWEDMRHSSNSRDVFGARLSSDGTVLDPNGIEIARATGRQTVPSVAALGTDWLVAWQDSRNVGTDDVYAARVSGSGTVSDPLGIPIVTGAGFQRAPVVSSDGTNWLVAWQDTITTQIWASRVSQAGAVLDPSGIQISAGGGTTPAVAYNGTNYLIAWTRPGAGDDVVAARMTPAGTVLDTGNLVVPLGVTATREITPSVASNGTDWLVTWENGYDANVRGARVNNDGTVLDPTGIDISTAANRQTASRAAWDGAQYWVVWQDERAVSGRQDLYGARITPGGVVTDPTGLVIVKAQDRNELSPAIAAGPFKETLLVYQRFEPAQPIGTTRAFARFLTDPTLGVNGDPCQSGALCVSGSCVDGVCCDTACSGSCVACTAAKKGAGVDGECGPVAMGADPDDECAAQGASTCGTTGSCNGAGACQMYAQGTSCGAVCVSDAAQPNACNGMGTCVAAGASTNCAPYACVDGACNTTCAADADCAAGNVCIGGVCGKLGANGAACASDIWCQSGACVDGVCCNTACTGLCEACTAAKKGSGANGVCGPIASGKDPENECALEAAVSCGQNGQCNGAGACQLHPQGTSCGASLCEETVVKGHICDGMGQCVIDPAGKDCAPHVCSAGSCKNPCANDNECLPGNICIGGGCKPPGMPGIPCSAGFECSSGFCIDGVCCDSACAGSCEACSTAKKGQGADGQCEPIKMGTDPDDECAAQPPSTCGLDGQCNGAGDCSSYAAGTECAAGSCAGTTQVSASQCDESGTCVEGTQVSCVEGYACVGNKCATSCTDDTACATGYVCNVAMKWCASSVQSGSGSASSSGAGGSEPGAGGGGAGGMGGASSGTGGIDSAGDEGCGCKVAGAPRATSLAPSALIAWALGIALRRRSRGPRGGASKTSADSATR